MAFAGKRITINLSDEDHLELTKLGRRSQTSLSQLGQFAIKHLLVRSEEALPLLPKLDLDQVPIIASRERVWTEAELEQAAATFPSQEQIESNFAAIDRLVGELKAYE